MVNAMDACPLHRNARRITASKERASKKNDGDEFDFRNSGERCTSVHYAAAVSALLYCTRVLTATDRPPDARCCGWLDVWHGSHAPPALKVLLPTGSHAGGPRKALLVTVGGYSFAL